MTCLDGVDDHGSLVVFNRWYLTLCCFLKCTWNSAMNVCKSVLLLVVPQADRCRGQRSLSRAIQLRKVGGQGPYQDGFFIHEC